MTHTHTGFSRPPGYNKISTPEKQLKQRFSHSVRPVVVVSHERVEGPQLHPSDTQLLSGVATKAADVRPRQRHPEQAELQHGWGEER